MNQIKAIETRYKGYRFRSRLEARWAVFFDRLGLSWEYEPEGFWLNGSKPYLPDFLVRSRIGWRFWYEVKNERVHHDDKYALFAEAMNSSEGGSASSLLSGDPFFFLYEREERPNAFVCPRCGFIGALGYGLGSIYASPERSIGCFPCDMTTPSGGGHPWEAGILPEIMVTPSKGWIDTDGWVAYDARVKGAALSARKARFEFDDVESGIEAL